MSEVVWHDAECGSYTQDLPLWRELAIAAGGGPVLDVGAGTGRVTLDLAARGHDVVALDLDAVLLAALRERAAALPACAVGTMGVVETVVADASSFTLDGRRFPLVVAPMQTVQLLGPQGRAGFLRAARAHVEPGGLVACALADAFDAFDADHVMLPLPDVRVVDAVHYSSQPIALRDEGTRVAIERIRQTLAADGSRTSEGNVIHLDRVAEAVIHAEAVAAGLAPLPSRVIDATDEHVGSLVVMFGG